MKTFFTHCSVLENGSESCEFFQDPMIERLLWMMDGKFDNPFEDFSFRRNCRPRYFP